MKRDEWGAFWCIVFFCAWALGLALLTGCSSTEGIRLDKSPQDTAEEAGCQPLPLCTIPPEANSTQLESALWACVHEYRALYSQCYHLAHPVSLPKLGPTAYGQSLCYLTDPVQCVPALPVVAGK